MGIDMNTKVLGIDIAKNTFQLHGVDGSGQAVLKKTLTAQSTGRLCC
jgi:hypothetical protein